MEHVYALIVDLCECNLNGCVESYILKWTGELDQWTKVAKRFFAEVWAKFAFLSHCPCIFEI